MNGIEIQHENIMNISNPDEQMSLVFHAGVLGHVPDYRAALKECYRVMKKDGHMIFTAPFFDIEKKFSSLQN